MDRSAMASRAASASGRVESEGAKLVEGGMQVLREQPAVGDLTAVGGDPDIARFPSSWSL
jgi:hypothetical protein